MKKTLSFLSLLFAGVIAFAQPANVYPSNLEENMYFDKYDEASSTIKGLYFMVLADGDNSRNTTPAFDVTIYLMPEGRSSIDDLIKVKTYPLDGIYHMGSHEFKNEEISLAGIDITPGNYRLGIWVNSNKSFTEDANDNATLFRNSIRITQNPASKSTKKKSDDGWGNWDDDEDDDW